MLCALCMRMVLMKGHYLYAMHYAILTAVMTCLTALYSDGAGDEEDFASNTRNTSDNGSNV
jgi:hypothetical protein